MVIERTDISFGPLRGARCWNLPAGDGSPIGTAGKSEQQRAHDRYDDGEGHTRLHKIAETSGPGPTTSVFTGEEIGVMKAADAASATVTAN
jgi:hypothetical protein